MGAEVARSAGGGDSMAEGKFRLVTRSDFDGLVCAVLLRELDLIDDIMFVHPKDMQDGKVEITDRDITTNLPYVPGCHLAFDHHSSEVSRLGKQPENLIIEPHADSAARVVYNYYGGKKKFPTIGDDMMAAVDKADAAKFHKTDILDPKGWERLSFLMDARTGLGRFREFRISNYQLMMDLIEHCRSKSIDEILELPDVRERVEVYDDHRERFTDQIDKCATVHGNCVVLDLRNEETIFAGNRFVIYAMFPECNISIHVLWGRRKANTVFAIGKSILDRSSRTDVGALCLEYGGGGHEAAGTCQVENDRILEEIVGKINRDG
jgi:nanoRNase/pAp phosphatase (c-di-AMP/oligoRNAs hydrolase)